MPKLYLFILTSFLCVNLFAQQEKTAKLYQLNPKKSKATIGTFSCKMNMKSTKKGSISASVGGQNFNGIINLFSTEVETKDNYKKNTITREFIKKRRKTITEINGQVITDGDESGIEGKTAKFTKKKGKWKLQNSSDFSEFGLKYLNEFYDPTKKESEMIIYPDNLEVGETRKLTSKNFPKPSQVGEINTGSGTIKLVRVEKINGDKIAVLDVDFQIETLHKIEKDQSKVVASFKGTIRRSLRTFIDTKVSLDFTMNTTNTNYVDEKSNAIVKIVIEGQMESNCKILN